MKIKRLAYRFCKQHKGFWSVYSFASNLKSCFFTLIHPVIPILFHKLTHQHPVFLIFTPEYANLGDHAIAYTESIILKDLGIHFKEITTAKLLQLENHRFLRLLNHSCVLINGGGNLGDLWPDIERLNRVLIQSLPNSELVFLPNSIFYSDTDDGKTLFSESKKIYNSHNHLYIYAREQISFEVMRNAYKNVSLVPDLVLMLNETEPITPRHGALLCLRQDVEGKLSKTNIQLVQELVASAYNDDVVMADNVLPYNVSPKRRYAELTAQFSRFRSAQIVITDRLHGMIFAAITGTNCIVLDSKSPKMDGTYQWLKHLSYIKQVKDITQIPLVLESFPLYPHFYNNNCYSHYYTNLKADLINFANKKPRVEG